MPVCRDRRGAPVFHSFTDAKLAENRIENLLHVYDANYFADRSQRLIEVNGNIFRRQSLAQGRLRAIA